MTEDPPHSVASLPLHFLCLVDLALSSKHQGMTAHRRDDLSMVIAKDLSFFLQRFCRHCHRFFNLSCRNRDFARLLIAERVLGCSLPSVRCLLLRTSAARNTDHPTEVGRQKRATFGSCFRPLSAAAALGPRLSPRFRHTLPERPILAPRALSPNGPLSIYLYIWRF